MEEDWVDVEMSNKKDLPIRFVETTKSSDDSIEFYHTVAEGALKRLEASKSPIFHVELGPEPLYSTFVKHLPSGQEKSYDCSTCRRFTNTFGDLALIREDGTLTPLFWSALDVEGNSKVNETFGPVVQAIQQRFDNATVTKEFKVVEKKKKAGAETAGGFSHMHIEFPDSRVRKEELPGFTSANTPELADMLKHILADYKLGTIRKVNQMLVENKLPQADNHKASAKWLLELVEQNKIGKGGDAKRQHNLLYLYAASSFIGSLKQMRSGALGVLLESVKENRPWHSIKAQWTKLVDPTQYMRPQVAPSAGNIAAAERLFEQLGLTKDDLKRRLLVQDDVPENVVIWASQAMKNAKTKDKPTIGKVFAAVQAKEKPAPLPDNMDLPATSITFTGFVNKVLPTAKKVECWVGNNDAITTFVTGFEGTKPLMQWHDNESKNLASHYIWQHNPPVGKHNLRPKAWNEVRCLIPLPSLWDGAPLTTTFPLVDPDGEEGVKYKYYHKQKGFRYLFVLEGNHESDFSYTPLFPENMKSEFHGIRATIEAFCRTEKLLDVEDGMARGGFVAGVEAQRDKSDQKLKMRVTKNNGEVGEYQITLFE